MKLKVLGLALGVSMISGASSACIFPLGDPEFCDEVGKGARITATAASYPGSDGLPVLLEPQPFGARCVTDAGFDYLQSRAVACAEAGSPSAMGETVYDAQIGLIQAELFVNCVAAVSGLGKDPDDSNCGEQFLGDICPELLTDLANCGDCEGSETGDDFGTGGGGPGRPESIG